MRAPRRARCCAQRAERVPGRQSRGRSQRCLDPRAVRHARPVTARRSKRAQRRGSSSQSRQSPVAFRGSRIVDPFPQGYAPHHAPPARRRRPLIGGRSIGRNAATASQNQSTDKASIGSSTAVIQNAVACCSASVPSSGQGGQPGDRTTADREPGRRSVSRADSGVALILVGEQLAQAAGRDVKADPVAPGAMQLDALLRRGDQRAEIHARRTRADRSGSEPARPSCSTYRADPRRSGGGMRPQGGAELVDES